MTIKNVFLWYHVRHINPVKVHPEGTTRQDKKNLLIVLITMESNFLCEKKVLVRWKKSTTFALTCFVMNAN